MLAISYLLRFARIAPLLLVLLAVLSALHGAHFRDFVVPARTGGLGRALVAALTFHLNFLEAQRGYLPGSWDVLWSLSVEEMFYLFFPLVCLLLGRGKLLVVFLLTFVALGPFGRTAFTHGNELWQEKSYLGGMDAIALGCLTAIFLDRHCLSRRILLILGSLGTALLIFILGFSFRAYDLGLGRYGLNMTIIAIGACMAISAAAQTGWQSPRFVTPFLRLGERSYEVYLTHMFVVFGLFRLFVLAGKPVKAVPALFVTVILIASLLGEGVARFYSEPMNRWLRKRWGDGKQPLGSPLGSADDQAQSKIRVAV